MTELCEDLSSEFDLTIVAALPGYTEKIDNKYGNKIFNRETRDNLEIVRIKLPKVEKTKKLSRVKYILSYFFLTFLWVLKDKKHDIVFSISQPPVLGGLTGLLTKIFKRSKFVYNIQDFNPEQIEAINYSSNKSVIKLMRKLDNLSCKYADNIIVVGRDMVNTLAKRKVLLSNNENVCIINNWIDEKAVYPLPKEDKNVQEFLSYYNLEGKFIIMYSGNIGLYYDLENIIKVAKNLQENKEIHFLFIGEGAVKQQMEDFVKREKLNNVTFLPYQDKSRLIYSLNVADVHLVANQLGIKGVSVPSKIYGVMAVGKPILGVLEEGSEAEILINQCDSGYVVKPKDYKEIEIAIKRFYNNSEETNTQMGKRGRKLIEEEFNKRISIENYKDLFNKM